MIKMNISEVKSKIEDHFEVSIDKKNRDEKHSNARRIFCYVARKNGYTYQAIGDAMSRPHDVALYHVRKVTEWIKHNDLAIRKDIRDIFHVYEGKLPKEKKLSLIHSQYDDLLMSVPAGMHSDILEMIRLKIGSADWKYQDNTKVFTAKGTDMTTLVF